MNAISDVRVRLKIRNGNVYIILDNISISCIDKMEVFKWVLLLSYCCCRICIVCYDRDLVLSFSEKTLADVIKAVNST